MTERYDAAIIGAGADGLAAASLLGRAGLRVIVVERHAEPGGRLATRQFHPGYFASPFTDTVAPIPTELFRALGLARHGAWSAPPDQAVALWPDRSVTAGSPQAARLGAEIAARHAAALAQAGAPAPPPPRRWNPFARPAERAWPPERWRHAALADLLAGHPADEAALIAAVAGEGRAVDPLAAGSALLLLAGTCEGVWRGALGGLGAALAAAARDAGAQIACNAEVSDIRCAKGRAAALGLADGREIAARAVLATLDLKRTFLSLFPWSELPAAAVKQIGNFRIAGARARLLVALEQPPASPRLKRLPRGAIHIAPDPAALVEAHAAWRSGVLAQRLPLALRFASTVDPALAPIGAAVMTVTIGAVPHQPFDGVWTHEKRDQLTGRVLDAIETVFPSLRAGTVASELLTPADIEQQLGATAGDLDGGEIAPDQMFAFRPGLAQNPPRTPVEGLYLAGPSSSAGPLGTGAAGAIAAAALLADHRAGRLA